MSDINEHNHSVSLSSNTRWYLVLRNKRSVGIASVGNIRARLSSELFSSQEIASNIVLLPTEEIAIQITPAP